MSSKVVFVFCASALLVQAAFGQYIPSGSYVTGNSIVDNDIFISGGGSASASASAIASAASLGGAGLAYGSGLASGLGLASGYGVASGSGSAGFGLGAGTVGYSGAAAGAGASGIVVGGGKSAAVTPLLITAISPIGPTGLAVASENAIEGNLLVTGQLPFLSAVAFEGALPTAGSGIATCGCGSGQVGITSEGFGRPNIYY